MCMYVCTYVCMYVCMYVCNLMHVWSVAVLLPPCIEKLMLICKFQINIVVLWIQLVCCTYFPGYPPIIIILFESKGCGYMI